MLHANSSVRPSEFERAATSGPRLLRPDIVWVPVGDQLVTNNVTIASAVGNLSTAINIPVNEIFDSQPTFQGSQISFLGGQATGSGLGSAFGSDLYWARNPYFLVDPLKHNELYLENGTNAVISTDHSRDATAHLLFARSRTFRNITPWASWATTQTSYPVDPNLTHQAPYELLYQWRDQLNWTANQATIWNFVTRDEVAQNGLGPLDVVWLPVDVSTGCYRLDIQGDIFDFNAEPLMVQNYGVINVSEYEGYYRISTNHVLRIQTPSISPTQNASKDVWIIGDATPGRLDFTSHYPGNDVSQGSILRFVNYTRPNPVGINVPLAIHEGWNFVTSMAGGVGRMCYDNKVDTGSGLSMLQSDSIFLEFGHAGMATLDARHLKLPDPTLETAIGFTKPWNNEPGVVGIQSSDFDISFLTKDQLSWDVVQKATNAQARSSWYVTASSTETLEFHYETGFITKTLHFNGDMPYVTRQRGNFTSTGF